MFCNISYGLRSVETWLTRVRTGIVQTSALQYMQYIITLHLKWQRQDCQVWKKHMPFKVPPIVKNDCKI